MPVVDLNADVGESFGRWTLGDDDAVLASVTSANVACGFHAGDPSTLRRTCASAATRGVAVGAQVSYRDLAGFGRRFVEVPPGELRDEVLYQLGALQGIAAVAGTRVAYVKPHGALYNAVVHHEGQAAAVVEAVATFARATGVRLPLVGLPGSVLLAEAARAGLETIPEGFPDRGYTSSGTLQPRALPGALVEDPDDVAERAVRMVVEGSVTSVDGVEVPLRVASLCVHGDSPQAGLVASRVRTALSLAGVTVRAFTELPDRWP